MSAESLDNEDFLENLKLMKNAKRGDSNTFSAKVGGTLKQKVLERWKFNKDDCIKKEMYKNAVNNEDKNLEGKK